MADDLIRYDVLVQDALRGVVRTVLREVATTGLRGDHHFYIAFTTAAPGVRISSRLRQQYPEEMTIVMQHQFWDLAVTDHGFEIGLSFGGIPERLLVPFDAIKGFFDPSVQFGLQFDPATANKTAQPSTTLMPTTLPSPQQDDSAANHNATDTAKKPAASKQPGDEPPAAPQPTPTPGAEVVSLDAFRKKP